MPALDQWCDAALRFRYRGGEGPDITMYNYGSPRVGNAAFAHAYNRSVPNSWRISNKLDVIPRVPRLMGYSHIGNSCSVTPDGTFEVNGEALCSQLSYACEQAIPIVFSMPSCTPDNGATQQEHGPSDSLLYVPQPQAGCVAHACA